MCACPGCGDPAGWRASKASMAPLQLCALVTGHSQLVLRSRIPRIQGQDGLELARCLGKAPHGQELPPPLQQLLAVHLAWPRKALQLPDPLAARVPSPVPPRPPPPPGCRPSPPRRAANPGSCGAMVMGAGWKSKLASCPVQGVPHSHLPPPPRWRRRRPGRTGPRLDERSARQAATLAPQVRRRLATGTAEPVQGMQQGATPAVARSRSTRLQRALLQGRPARRGHALQLTCPAAGSPSSCDAGPGCPACRHRQSDSRSRPRRAVRASRWVTSSLKGIRRPAHGGLGREGGRTDSWSERLRKNTMVAGVSAPAREVLVPPPPPTGVPPPPGETS